MDSWLAFHPKKEFHTCIEDESGYYRVPKSSQHRDNMEIKLNYRT